MSPIERESVNKLETIFVWSPDKLDLADVQRFFSSYSPLSVSQLSRHSAQAGVNIMSFARTECAREPQVCEDAITFQNIILHPGPRWSGPLPPTAPRRCSPSVKVWGPPAKRGL